MSKIVAIGAYENVGYPQGVPNPFVPFVAPYPSNQRGSNWTYTRSNGAFKVAPVNVLGASDDVLTAEAQADLNTVVRYLGQLSVDSQYLVAAYNRAIDKDLAFTARRIKAARTAIEAQLSVLGEAPSVTQSRVASEARAAADDLDVRYSQVRVMKFVILGGAAGGAVLGGVIGMLAGKRKRQSGGAAIVGGVAGLFLGGIAGKFITDRGAHLA